VTRWFGWSLSVADPFVCRCLTNPTLLRFHAPLIEPDMRDSCIRLPEKGSRVRPRKTARPQQVATVVQMSHPRKCRATSHLTHPARLLMICDASKGDPPAVQVNEA